jgi:hypothetical protein
MSQNEGVYSFELQHWYGTLGDGVKSAPQAISQLTLHKCSIILGISVRDRATHCFGGW